MNIFDDKIEVDKPQGVSTQSLMLYVPKVTAQNAGIATYDNEDFIISKGNVSLYKLQNIAEISYDDKHLARSGAVKQYIDTIKIDLDDVKNELAKKASILYVDTQDDIIKQSITNLDIRLTNEINKKADITYVDNKLDTKADITYVDSKFNNMKSYVDGNVLRLDNNIGTINDKINAIVGIGGYLTAHNFGTATPTQKELTDYALSQISSISSADEIWNGTKITNLYDNHTWVLTNTPNTEPAIFEWSDIGFEFISVATTDRLGVVKGSTDDYKVSIANDGTMSINNLELKLSGIDDGFADVYTKFSAVNGSISNLETEIENNIGLIDKVTFVGILEDNRLKFYLHESQKNFEFRNNREYNLLLHLPLTTLTGDLDNNLPIDLYNKPISQKNDATVIARIVLNSILSNDPTNTTTVGKLCQLQNYSPTNGYTWNFNGDYIQYEENGITHRIIYTTDITRESNPSMSGADLAMAISDASLKSGTTVIVTSNYTDNGYNYLAGHTYLIKGEWIDNELVLSTLELQTGGSTYTAGNNISIENNVIDTKNVLRLDASEPLAQDYSLINLGQNLTAKDRFLGLIASKYYKDDNNYNIKYQFGNFIPNGRTDSNNDNGLSIIVSSDSTMGNDVFIRRANYGDFRFPSKSGIFALTNDLPKYSGLVLNQMNGYVNGDNVNLIFDKIDLSTGEGGTADSYTIAPASETTPGLMTSADVKALSDLQQRVGNLEQKATRLIYTAKTDPTAEEINTFVTGLGYTAPFSGITVVVDKTYHIWHFYENDGWKDDGMDTVNIFTNETAGAIKGAGEIAGKVYAENDGTGSVYGWDALNASVAGKQDKLTAGNNISIENGVIDTKNPVGVELTADATTLTQEQLDILKADDENYIITEIGLWKFYYTGTAGQNRRYYHLNDSKSGPGIQIISVNGTSGEITRTSSFLKSSNCFVQLNGEVGNLTALQSTLLTNWKQLYQIELADKGLFLNYVKSETIDGKNYNYYSATDCGIEYNIVCDLTSKTWTLTKRYLEIEVPLNTDGTISDDSLALITKYGEHTYIMNSNIRYNFVKKETGKKNFILYSNIENVLSRIITVLTDNKTWMEQSYLLADRPDMVGSFKLYNDQWVATESSNGAFKQVVTYTHFVNNYHQYTILPLSSSLRMWAECGVGAFEETANDITFYAQTKPTDSLSFNIKHEQVEYSEV